ncbi:FKBP-type peptidyl-prolyl cis-trans isomerase [Nocardioides sp.]|uniref:FKBP-type peptidyl-prolyl cis-trans isomerase n=1 Tax=Nocardioides sp. TaxID=35761 RepID=UPI003D13661E
MRRLIALLGLLSLLFSLVACGDSSDDNGDSGASGGLEAVSVTGDVGKAPKVTWNSAVSSDKLDTDVLVAGDGDEVAKGDQVSVNIWIGNGFTKKQVFSSYDKGGAPETITVDDAQIFKALYVALEGQTVGSRVLVVSPPADAFGDQGNATLSIGNTDHVVFVVDIMKKIVVLDGPQGAEQTPPPNAPKLVEKGGVPTGFDFSASAKKPGTKLRIVPLIKGDGDKVTNGQNITVNYLGQVYGTKTVFDESFSKTPFSTTIGTGSVIKGWDQGLVGQTVGSRVILVIPPDLAYGPKGQGTIPGNATLTFVVDILSAS